MKRICRHPQRTRRREEALNRKMISDLLNPTQRIAVLDYRLGKDEGAVRERARLSKKV